MASPYLVYIADVYCPWCYGFSTIITQLHKEYPHLPIKVFGGDLMSRPTDLQTYASEDPDLEKFWLQVQSTVHLSLAGAINALNSGKKIRMSSPAADLVFTSLKRLAPGHALEQFIMLEHMFYEQGKDIFTDASLAEMSKMWNIDEQTLIAATNSPKNEQATEDSLETASELMAGITSYPTVLLVRDNKVDAVSRGYVHYETVQSRLEGAMRDLGITTDEDAYCSWTGNCAFGQKRNHSN